MAEERVAMSSSNSSSLHAPQSRYQELEVALDSSSATINQLNENVESLRIGELEQAPSAVSMQQQEEDRNSENKSAPQLEQQVKELQEKKLSEEMKEDIWTLRRRRCLSPCQASWRTWRAGRPWAAGERRGAEQRGKPVVKPSGLVRTHSLSREQHGRNCSHESVISTWSCPRHVGIIASQGEIWMGTDLNHIIPFILAYCIKA
ncbi:uncharacterized protein LOC126947336 isoform X2 [Macaca thibetana thibetana]|uniref:uncharacterized protein LOC126947336 isoform X2 n=1 Tax=Macaca thibetana thibetana TaxID=257877 RepID=UPI0021BCF3BD|nr:uncharacterized protein LOC126947336 isoform X2 [Macaca thibetana thibetana]